MMTISGSACPAALCEAPLIDAWDGAIAVLCTWFPRAARVAPVRGAASRAAVDLAGRRGGAADGAGGERRPVNR